MPQSEIRIYGVVGDAETGLDARSICAAIDEAGAGSDITVRINSAGGYVTEGLPIYNRLREHRGRVTCIVDGLAASMASVIAMAGDDVLIPPAALMMIHDPSGIVLGTAEDMRKTAETLDKMADVLATAYAERSGMKKDKIRALMAAETWMTGAEAVEMGFATALDADEPDETQMTAALRDLARVCAVRNMPERYAARVEMPAIVPVGSAAQAVASTQEREMSVESTAATNAADDVKAAAVAVDAAKAQAEGSAAERRRVQELRALAKLAKVEDATLDAWIADGTKLFDAQTAALEVMAARSDAIETRHGVRVTSGVDEREKFARGATAWLAQKAGTLPMLAQHAKATGEAVETDPGEFRGYSLMELARASLERAGVRTAGMDKLKLAYTALMSTTSDFPVLLETTINKTLLAAYATTPDTWSSWCRTGSVSDFRASNRYRVGSFGVLDRKTEASEFLNRAIPDGEKQSISIGTRGNIISISREAIINDDMGAFSSLATAFGRAARLSIESDVYASLALNSAAGPTMSDTQPLFHSTHNNIAGTAAAPSVASLDAARVQMAQQRDVSSNEFLDLRPAIWLGPIGLGGTVRVVNDAQYDVDVSNKFQVPNRVRGLVSTIIDTPRLSGTRWYVFADPSIAPVMEVAFLDGNQTPFLESEEGFRVDGVSWKVRLDYGVAAIDWRGAVTNAGA